MCVPKRFFFLFLVCGERHDRLDANRSSEGRKKMSIDKRKKNFTKQQQKKRNRNKNVLLIINAFLWFHSRSSCLNRQIYYCIQFSVYGILRERPSQLFFPPCFIIPDCQSNGKVNCRFEAMCRPCLAQFCSRQCSSRSTAWRVQYEINFFAQNNIQFSIITLLLSNSLTRARFSSLRINF